MAFVAESRIAAMSGDSGKGSSKPPASGDGKGRSGSNEYHRRTRSEETPLLAAVTDVPFAHGPASPDETFGDDELADTEIDPNEFDIMLSRSTSYTAGIGMEPQTLETAMLRGPRRYSTAALRRPSMVVTVRRRSVVDATAPDEEAIEDEEEEDVEVVMLGAPTRFLGGISTPTFWLIFGVVLANTFVRDRIVPM